MVDENGDVIIEFLCLSHALAKCLSHSLAKGHSVDLPVHKPITTTVDMSRGLQQASKALEKLKEKAQRAGDIFVIAEQLVKDILSEEDLQKARELEDYIEEMLEAKYDLTNPKEAIILDFKEEIEDRIFNWLAGRYPAWNVNMASPKQLYFVPK
jgi:ribosomal protein L17